MAILLDLPPSPADSRSTYATDFRETPSEVEERWTSVISRREGEPPSSVGNGPRGTDFVVQEAERGNQYNAERNLGDTRGGVPRLESTETDSSDGETVRIRSEVARDICGRIDDLIPLIGEVAFATKLQLLKRELSQCHHLLRDRHSETNFISIVTLIESAMSQLKWKEYTREQLELIRAAADIGYRKITVLFADYDDLRRKLSKANVEAKPLIDLDALNLDEFPDEEEEDQTPHLS